jgi:hypothetical protein
MTNPDFELSQVFDLSMGTWIVFALIGGGALKVISGHASVLSRLLAVPAVLLMSVATYNVLRAFEFFNQDKTPEWLAWTFMSGTGGTLVGLGFVILVDRLFDREPAR